MSCDVIINGDATVYQNCCDGNCGFIESVIDPANNVRLKTCNIIAYWTDDVMTDPKPYHIVFFLEGMGEQRWKYLTIADRDAALAKLKLALGVKDI